MKMYHTETQADYDTLMIELEEQGCMWVSGVPPTAKEWWHGKEPFIKVENNILTWESSDCCKKHHPSAPVINYTAKGAGALMKPTKETSIVKEVTAYQINTKIIRVDSVIQYRERGKDWVRGLVKFVDKCSIKVVRSFGTNHSLSSTSIGSGDIEIKVEIY